MQGTTKSTPWLKGSVLERGRRTSANSADQQTDPMQRVDEGSKVDHVNSVQHKKHAYASVKAPWNVAFSRGESAEGVDEAGEHRELHEGAVGGRKASERGAEGAEAEGLIGRADGEVLPPGLCGKTMPEQGGGMLGAAELLGEVRGDLVEVA